MDEKPDPMSDPKPKPQPTRSKWRMPWLVVGLLAGLLVMFLILPACSGGIQTTVIISCLAIGLGLGFCLDIEFGGSK